MEEKDITANMAREAIARQSNEEGVAAVFRLHIMRFWSRERIENFCLHLLGVDMQEYREWRQAVEQSVQADSLTPRPVEDDPDPQSRALTSGSPIHASR